MNLAYDVPCCPTDIFLPLCLHTFNPASSPTTKTAAPTTTPAITPVAFFFAALRTAYE
jgi:hypothetical protein